MKAEELMIGDWVKLKDAKLGYIKFNGPTVKIESVVPPNVYVQNYKGLLEDVKDEYLLPVPLTPEILEKNGFKLLAGVWYFQTEERRPIQICFKDNNKIATLSINSTPVPINLEFVHQLQHALRLYGIDKKIVL